MAIAWRVCKGRLRRVVAGDGVLSERALLVLTVGVSLCHAACGQAGSKRADDGNSEADSGEGITDPGDAGPEGDVDAGSPSVLLTDGGEVDAGTSVHDGGRYACVPGAGISETGYTPDASVMVTTIAGNDGFCDGTGGADGTSAIANPFSVAVDSADNVYVASQNRIRKIDPSGNVTTLAGNGTAGYADGTGGPRGSAEFDAPTGVAVDAQGFVYVADYLNNRIRKIDPSGNVTTLSGNGQEGHADGTGGSNGTAEFANPFGLTVDAEGTLYTVDGVGIRKIDRYGNVSTLLAPCTSMCAFPASPATGGQPIPIWDMFGIATASNGNIWVSNLGRVLELSPDGVVVFVAGNGTVGNEDGTGGVDGTAEFGGPNGIAVDGAGNVYVADFWNNNIRQIDPSGNVTTVAGNVGGFADGSGGPLGSAEFYAPYGVALDRHGNIYVADWDNNRVREIDTSHDVSTLAANGGGLLGGWYDGTSGPYGTAQFNDPHFVTSDGSGNLFVGDVLNDCVRMIDPSGHVSTFAGRPGKVGFVDGSGGLNGSALFFYPTGVVADNDSRVYVADALNCAIRVIEKTGTVRTLAGSGGCGFADGAAPEFNSPNGIALDVLGNVVVADSGNNRIRRVDPRGYAITIAGNGVAGFADGSGGPNGTAEFNQPAAVALDTSGNIYVADLLRVRKIDCDGNVTTLAGNGTFGSIDGPGGANGVAEFGGPSGITVDTDGYVYVGDCYENNVRMIDPEGNVTTLAGNGQGAGTGDLGLWVDGPGGPHGLAEFDCPDGLALDGSGGLYVADVSNERIRHITFVPP